MDIWHLLSLGNRLLPMSTTSDIDYFRCLLGAIGREERVKLSVRRGGLARWCVI